MNEPAEKTFLGQAEVRKMYRVVRNETSQLQDFGTGVFFVSIWNYWEKWPAGMEKNSACLLPFP